MALDAKEIVGELLEKISKDDDLRKQFKKDPVKTVEKLTGIDLPNDQVDKLVEGIKAKINVDKLSGMLGGLFGR